MGDEEDEEPKGTDELESKAKGGMNYYNENDPKSAAWLRELVDSRLIPSGEIDSRSIVDVEPGDLRGFAQCHFFAGIAGWPFALKLADWPEQKPIWTGSCPCQPLSCAGKQKGHADERHLWPAFYRLIAKCKPATIFGEQVASKDGREWLSGVRADLEGVGYAVGASDLCAASVGAPHTRQRLYWVANTSVHGCEGLQRCTKAQVSKDGAFKALGTWHGSGSPFENWKKLLAQPYVFRVDDGISSTVDIRPRLHAYGNAVVPQVAAEFIKSAMEVF